MMEDNVTEHSTGLTVSVKLGSNLLSVFLVTYLPTILMNFINQATNYLKTESKCDLVVTVNVTCMMVLASVYLSVSTSLPSTQAIKPVEVWLLFNLAYPLLVITTNILLQVCLVCVGLDYYIVIFRGLNQDQDTECSAHFSFS